MADRHPLVGSWTVTVTIPGAPGPIVNLARFSLDGGVCVAQPSPIPAAPGQDHTLEWWSTALGEWRATDDRSASLRFVSLGSADDGAPLGTHTITAQLTADAAGQTLSGPFQIAITNPGGKAVGEFSGTVSATRIAAD